MFATVAERPVSFLGHLSSAVMDLPTRLWPSRRRAARLENVYRAARIALGERMYAAGIDDGETGEQILDMDLRIRLAKIMGQSWEALEGDREKLVIKLADAALENDAPLPGADREFALALDLKNSIQAVSSLHG